MEKILQGMVARLKGTIAELHGAKAELETRLEHALEELSLTKKQLEEVKPAESVPAETSEPVAVEQ